MPSRPREPPDIPFFSLFLSILGGFAIPPLQQRFVPSVSMFTPFRIVGLWHFIRLLPVMIPHVQGELSDWEFAFVMCIREHQLHLYFAPWLTKEALRLIWPARWLLSAGFLAMTALYRMLPTLTELGERTVKSRFNILILQSWYSFTTTPLSIRGLFFRVHDALRFSNYWINVSSAHRKRSVVGKSLNLRPYQYLPLDSNRHVRLLYLSRQRLDLQLRVKLVQYPIEDTPPYEALSYTWGPLEPSTPLAIGDQAILVTNAVEEFLFFQRSMVQSQLFWIDAICINQADKDEKSTQIPLMAEIYERAMRVLVWLAPPTNLRGAVLVREAALSMGLLREVGYTAGLVSSSIAMSDRESPLPLHDPICAEIGLLISNLWFRRKWIIQELVMASEVHILYAGACLEWEDVFGMNDQISQSNAIEIRTILSVITSKKQEMDAESKTSDALLGLHDLIRSRRNIYSLDWIRQKLQNGDSLAFPLAVSLTGWFECRDPRDKVYALYGLLNPETSLHVRPSYVDSTDTLSRDIATYLLSTDDWFELLRISVDASLDRAKKENKLPSWMFDLELDGPKTVGLSSARSFPPNQAEERDMSGKVTKTADLNIIRVECKVAAVLQRSSQCPMLAEEVTPKFTTKFDTLAESLKSGTADEIVKAVAEWYTTNQNFARELLRTEVDSVNNADEVFWEACTYGLDELPPDYPTEKVKPRSLLARRFVEVTLRAFPKHFSLSHFDQPTDRFEYSGITIDELVAVFMFLLNHILLTHNRQLFCALSTGQLAIVPYSAQVGDVIAHIRGGYLPAILRESKKGSKRAELVGFCYVHGMDDIYHGDDWEDWELE